MFHVVLLEPEIPQNTGSVGRLCLATQSTLHLIEPFGFELSDAHLKRAGLDYWQHLDVRTYSGYPDFESRLPKDSRLFFFSKKAGRTLFEASLPKGSYLVFGKETAGLPDSILNRHADATVRIPLFDARVRSLNLANAVSIAVYEGIRQNL